MREALFALAGTALGILSTFGVDIRKGRRDDRRERREILRSAHGEARAQYERLRLTATSLKTQQEARYALRYAVGLWRQVEGRVPRPDEQQRSPLHQLEERLLALYGEVRAELGVPNARLVFSEPDDLRHLPTRTDDSDDPA